jgi:hypothetical protein
MYYYALWYYASNHEKSTNAISNNQEFLMALHQSQVSNPKSYYHTYKDCIYNITTELIPMYRFNKITNTLSPLLQEYNYDTDVNGAIYATYYPIDKITARDLEEILVYLSKAEYDLWKKCYDQEVIPANIGMGDYPPKFFYETPISNRIVPNTYYAEGILNV